MSHSVFGTGKSTDKTHFIKIGGGVRKYQHKFRAEVGAGYQLSERERARERDPRPTERERIPHPHTHARAHT